MPNGAVEPGRKHANLNGADTPSLVKILLVIVVATAGILTSVFVILNYNGWYKFTPNPPVEQLKSNISKIANQIPEVKTFLAQYPHARANVELTDYSYNLPAYTPQSSNLTLAEAKVTYNDTINYPYKLFQIQPKLEIFLRNSSSPQLQQSETTANVTRPPFDGYYYTAAYHCHIESLGSGNSIAGFPNGTYLADLNKDCWQVENLSSGP